MPGIFREDHRKLGRHRDLYCPDPDLLGSLLQFHQPRYDGYWIPPSIEADSGTYYRFAGIGSSSFEYQSEGLSSFAGNLFGPVLIAKVLRYPFCVAIFNFFLLLLMIQTAAQIPVDSDDAISSFSSS